MKQIEIIESVSGLGRELAIQMGELNSIVVCLDVDDEANEKTAELVKAGGGIAFAWVDVCSLHVCTAPRTIELWADKNNDFYEHSVM